MPDGVYQVRVGLWNGPTRATLYGNNDGNQRYTVGSITVSNNGSSIAFTAIPITIPNPDPRMNSSGAIVNFGTLQTDGMVLLQQLTGQTTPTIQISSYPRSRDTVIRVDFNAVTMPASMTCDNGDVLIPSALPGNYWQVDLRGRKYCTFNGTIY
jgi:hypothetical protein